MSLHNPIYGGAGQLDLYRARKNSGGTALEILQATGTSAATARATSGHLLYTINDIEQSQIQPQDDGTMQIVLTQYDVSPDFINKVLNPFANPVGTAAGRAPSSFFLETGIERGGTAATSGEMLLAISYGPLDPDPSPTKRLMHWGLFNLTKSSGQVNYKDQTYIAPTFTLKSVAAEFELEIVEALFDSTFLDISSGIGDQVLQQYHHYEREYLLKQA